MPNQRKEKFFKFLKYSEGAEFVGKEGFIKIIPTQATPKNVISFSEWRAKHYPEGYWVDHFIDDYQFECVYNNCEKYLSYYQRAEGVIGTDFSACRNMSSHIRKHNVGRNREIDHYLQSHGVNIIPVASYAYYDDFSWCLDGLPHNSSIAISTNGSMKNFVSHEMFISGAIELQRRLSPTHLIISGGPVPELDKRFDNIIYYQNYSQRLNARRQNNG